MIMEKAQENAKGLKNNFFNLMSSILDTKKMYSTTKTTSSPSLSLTGQAKSVGQRNGSVEVKGALGEGKVTACNALATSQGREQTSWEMPCVRKFFSSFSTPPVPPIVGGNS